MNPTVWEEDGEDFNPTEIKHINCQSQNGKFKCFVRKDYGQRGTGITIDSLAIHQPNECKIKDLMGGRTVLECGEKE